MGLTPLNLMPRQAPVCRGGESAARSQKGEQIAAVYACELAIGQIEFMTIGSHTPDDIQSRTSRAGSALGQHARAKKSCRRFQRALVVIHEFLDAFVGELMFQIKALP